MDKLPNNYPMPIINKIQGRSVSTMPISHVPNMRDINSSLDTPLGSPRKEQEVNRLGKFDKNPYLSQSKAVGYNVADKAKEDAYQNMMNTVMTAPVHRYSKIPPANTNIFAKKEFTR